MANCGRSGAVLRRGRVSVLCALLVLGGVALFREDAFHAPGKNLPASSLTSTSLLARLPLVFEPNVGQSNQPVKFLARGRGFGVYLTPQEAVLTLSRSSAQRPGPSVRMQFAGASSSAIKGVGSLPGHTNYFIGNDASRWRRNVPQFGRVRYDDLYPGINLDFYGQEGRLEYDFTVAPGADPREIALDFDGADGMQIANNGDLVLTSAGRELRFQVPHIYQTSSAGEEAVEGRFVLLAKDRAGFDIGRYDRSRELVIDPVLAFSTYLGGSGDESCGLIVNGSIASPVPHCPAIAADSASRVYIAGTTTSDGGTFPGASGPALAGTADVFVARISNSGSGLVLDFLTYLGASGTQYPVGVGIDSGFNVYVAGNTNSTQFPTVNGLASPSGGSHAFLSKLDPGANLLYSTYLAGSGTETASDLALDTQAHAYVIGTTTSPDFPTTPGALQSSYPSGVTNQFFFAKLDPAQTGSNSLLYATYFGGASSGGAMSGGAVAVDSTLNVYVAGGTNFTDIPIVNAYQSNLKGGVDVWAAKLKAPATNTQQYALLYETYLGGSGNDVAYGVATDGTNMFLTGSTSSSDFTLPTGTTAFQSANGGGATDAFVARFGTPATTGTTQGLVPLNYFTYLGGGGADAGLSITVDSTGNARLTGYTTGGFSNLDPLPNVSGGGTDAFFARIMTGSGGSSSTSLLGGSGSDVGTSLVTDVTFNSYLGGETNSGNFPASSSSGQPQVTALQASRSGNTDAFISKLGPTITGLTLTCPTGTSFNGATINACNPTAANVNPSPAGVGNQIKFTFPIYNTGDPVNGGIFTASTFGTAASLDSATTGSVSGTCSKSSSSTTTSIVCSLGTLGTSSATTSNSVTTLASAATVTVSVTPTAPTTPLPATTAIGVTGVLNVAGTTLQSTLGAQGQVNDFVVSASPNSQTVTAGNQATYTITVTPTGVIPESVSLGSCSGLPAGAACTFSGNPIPNLNNLAQSRTLNITTTPRVTTPAGLFRSRSIFYAFWLPISGLAFVGVGVTRKRRWLAGALVSLTVALMALQAGCSSSSSNTTTTAGTPAGTYTVTMSASSGSASRTTAVTLVVQ